MNRRPNLYASITALFESSSRIKLDLLREDLLGGAIQGNKYRKLLYNLRQAEKQQASMLITFGGAYSNHIAATAAAAQQFGFKAMGIIRGDELKDRWKQNPTLVKAAERGMEFRFVSRSQYRLRNSEEYLRILQSEYPRAYIIPEGGTNTLAIKGCKEILGSHTEAYDIICVPVGTGGTMAGLIEGTNSGQNVLGFAALKGNFLNTEVAKWTQKSNWEINFDYSFGGYAKINSELIAFINSFKKDRRIALDPVYTAKMLFGLFELIKSGAFPENSRILAVHTGGLQGIEGMKDKIAQKGLPPLTI